MPEVFTETMPETMPEIEEHTCPPCTIKPTIQPTIQPNTLTEEKIPHTYQPYTGGDNIFKIKKGKCPQFISHGVNGIELI